MFPTAVLSEKCRKSGGGAKTWDLDHGGSYRFHAFDAVTDMKEISMGRGTLFWLLGIPLPIIIRPPAIVCSRGAIHMNSNSFSAR